MEAKDKLIKKYEKYVELLTKELNETSELATFHAGWVSSKSEEGKTYRNQIKKLKKTIKKEKEQSKKFWDGLRRTC